MVGLFSVEVGHQPVKALCFHNLCRWPLVDGRVEAARHTQVLLEAAALPWTTFVVVVVVLAGLRPEKEGWPAPDVFD